MGVIKKGGVLLLPILFIFVLSGTGCTTIESGSTGVRFRFGKVQDKELNPGINFYIPIVDSIKLVDVRVKKMDFTRSDAIETLTKDGLKVDVELSILYALIPEYAAETIVKYTTDWDNRLILPILRSSSRDVASEYTASNLYQRRIEFGKKLKEIVIKKLEGAHIKVENLLIRNIQIPEKVAQAIEMKIQAQQDAERMKYVLEKENREARRKEIEAKGIAKANKIIAGSLSQKYLQWKYIDTLEKLVNSPNNTVIILPFGQDMLPILPINPGRQK